MLHLRLQMQPEICVDSTEILLLSQNQFCHGLHVHSICSNSLRAGVSHNSWNGAQPGGAPEQTKKHQPPERAGHRHLSVC